MKLAIMQPYFFPYLGYFQLIHSCDSFIFYDDVQYIKGGWVNRNRIQYRGEVRYINAMIEGASANKRINELQVVENIRWKDKLLKNIESCYYRAPQFDQVFPLISEIVNTPFRSLSEFNINGLKKLCKHLSIDKEFIVSSAAWDNDHLKGLDRVLDICKRLNCDFYINASNGRILYKKEDFEREHIRLAFIKMKDLTYNQSNTQFSDNLSILDAMMYNDVTSMGHLLRSYTLEQ